MEPKLKTSRFRMLVEDLLPSLGTQEGKIAIWMLEHEKELVDTPIKDIAINCGVSQPSVVRFCKKLGCNGIKDLKILVDGMRSDTENSIPCTFDDSDKDIYQKVFASSIESIERSFSFVTWDEVSILSKNIINASTISVFGIGGSSLAARHLSEELLRLGLKSMCFTDPFSISSSASTYTDKDLLIFVSREGMTTELVDKAQKAKNSGAAIALITTNDSSSLFSLSDYALLVSENQYLFDDRNSFSRLGELAVIESIYIMCAKKIGEKNPNFRENYFGLTNYKKENY